MEAEARGGADGAGVDPERGAVPGHRELQDEERLRGGPRDAGGPPAGKQKPAR